MSFSKAPSPAMVVEVIALTFAIGGGAAIGASKIQTGDIAKQAVTNKKIAKKTIKASRVAERNRLAMTRMQNSPTSLRK